MQDARFADADPRPLALMAADDADLRVISALSQDAVLPGSDIIYDSRARQVALLLNRFRWEDATDAEREGRAFERVRSVLLIRDALRLQSDGITRDGETVLELLAVQWQPGDDGTGRLVLDFAGDGSLAVDCECLNVELRDVTRPYAALSGRKPVHPD
ncbi:DUF2948 family protein [Paracoccus sp. (in: a-proteobacteria)]|uniref:DUF2948 family protein n=1 Tax=Paracoccus sp. TaxID=267 RepID=UPI0026E0E634|nr:DUF2948 family protein [Paracoccus sp. (in: a-proteobacteria)]MDO5648507.1 DUF2948 family protein [Paracoccus sp. (in: a-proteobacteria)]